ncbi:hypothetical protein C7B32_23295, partial [Salmonella enterica subsp. enterica serovar Schwarzengrund]|nr:hypothetical protein [Salmonella enterica subsp. enterica serovar Schwarzengrund]EEM4146201.1 hypothetical protein [Salmonella enterica subsp. enterica serovar Schwarzengrund]
MSEIFFIVWGVIGIFIIGIGFICLYEFIKSRYEDKIDGLQSLVFKLEHKLDCVVYECKKRGFDLEDDLDYDDDD